MKHLFRSFFMMLMGVGISCSESIPGKRDRKGRVDFSNSHLVARHFDRVEPDSLGQETTALSKADVALRMMCETQFDLENYVEIESGENSFLGGFTHFSRVCYVDGVWLLMQRDIRKDDWEVNAISIREGIVYFARLGDKPGLFGGECVMCHSNGLRALRGKLRHGTPELLAQINEQVRRMKVVRPYLPPTDLPQTTEQLELAPCIKCHNGKTRSFLFGLQVGSIRYMLEQGHMPPDEGLTKEVRRELFKWVRAQYAQQP